jgi:hypothetical protein
MHPMSGETLSGLTLLTLTSAFWFFAWLKFLILAGRVRINRSDDVRREGTGRVRI